MSPEPTGRFKENAENLNVPAHVQGDLNGAEPAKATCPTCSHSMALHNPMGMCWQPVIRTERDKKAKFCGCLTEETAEHLAALRTTTPEKES